MIIPDRTERPVGARRLGRALPSCGSLTFLSWRDVCEVGRTAVNRGPGTSKELAHVYAYCADHGLVAGGPLGLLGRDQPGFGVAVDAIRSDSIGVQELTDPPAARTPARPATPPGRRVSAARSAVAARRASRRSARRTRRTPQTTEVPSPSSDRSRARADRSPRRRFLRRRSRGDVVSGVRRTARAR